jgi:hypothetical protein
MIVLSHWQKKKIGREKNAKRTDVDARLRVKQQMITIVKSSYV